VAQTVYVAEHGPRSGKSAIALGIAELLSRKLPGITAFRPVALAAPPGGGTSTPPGGGSSAPGATWDAAGDDWAVGGAIGKPTVDPFLELLWERYAMPVPVEELSGIGADEAAALTASGAREELVSRIVERFREVARRSSAVVVLGGDLEDQATGVAFNARLASEFGATVVVVVNGSGQVQAGVDALARGAYHGFTELGASVAAVVVNRVGPDVRPPALPASVYVVPEVPAVAAPTVAEVAGSLRARLLTAGDTEAALDRDVLHYVVGAAQVSTVMPYLGDNCLLLTPGDRADLLLAAAGVQAAGLATLAGVVVTLGLTPQAAVMEVFERLAPGVAVLAVDTDSYDTIAASTRIEHRLGAASPRKVQAALGAFESHVDRQALARDLDVHRSSRTTPLMFEYELIDRARQRRRHLVLPEGTDDRILRATDALLRRDVCELTLLGDPDPIRRRCRELGLDIDRAHLVDPERSDHLDEFASIYADLRRHKGMTLDLAHDVVRDATYFGTMMVHQGLADGMVSGATHTTAATIRPAFEIIKIVPGVSVASSVFFMLLPDRVLLYGDCAVNPDPDAGQLADIAVSCADTATMFGIPPRVAMLSYSSGTSGAGADVTKVAEATAKVRERRPDLPVEGPIQYDAAVDPTVAAAKLPGSVVAGSATVFVFPDLNTGNNTYKAVQRSAGVVAVGPVMQGLRSPVNDLSRGATVKDIINTIAITAIQAARENPAAR
jgi:phosphate acetyltransferase